MTDEVRTTEERMWELIPRSLIIYDFEPRGLSGERVMRDGGWSNVCYHWT